MLSMFEAIMPHAPAYLMEMREPALTHHFPGPLAWDSPVHPSQEDQRPII